MNRRKYPAEHGNQAIKSPAQKLKERLARQKGQFFKQSGFYPIDATGRILEKAFQESEETVQVHLTGSRKIQTVYLLKSIS